MIELVVKGEVLTGDILGADVFMKKTCFLNAKFAKSGKKNGSRAEIWDRLFL